MITADYIGKVCPYCRCAFTAEDDIVLCSACEMPHHRDCWVENQGCTTFGCQGTIQGIDGSASVVTSNEIVFEDAPAQAGFCPKCGAPHNGQSRFCGRCGNALKVSGYCTRCGAPHSGQAFCGKCGNPLR